MIHGKETTAFPSGGFLDSFCFKSDLLLTYDCGETFGFDVSVGW